MHQQVRPLNMVGVCVYLFILGMKQVAFDSGLQHLGNLALSNRWITQYQSLNVFLAKLGKKLARDLTPKSNESNDKYM